MIKPEDLRIGNYVFDNLGGILKIKGISTDSDLSHIRPIPLTEKILLAGGFYIDETKNASIMLPNNEVLILELNNKGIYTDYAYGTEIEYLHNLQNLHKELSKTELIIKL